MLERPQERWLEVVYFGFVAYMCDIGGIKRGWERFYFQILGSEIWIRLLHERSRGCFFLLGVSNFLAERSGG